MTTARERVRCPYRVDEAHDALASVSRNSLSKLLPGTYANADETVVLICGWKTVGNTQIRPIGSFSTGIVKSPDLGLLSDVVSALSIGYTRGVCTARPDGQQVIKNRRNKWP